MSSWIRKVRRKAASGFRAPSNTPSQTKADPRADELRAQADAARDAGNWPDARRLYQDYLALQPTDGPIWVQLGHARKETGSVDEAEKAYMCALEIDSDSADTHLQLGHVQKLRGRLQEALDCYQRACELDPSNVNACMERDTLVNMLAELASTAALSGATLPLAENTGSSGHLRALEENVRVLQGQARALRVLGGEVLKARRENAQLREQVVELQARVEGLQAETSRRLTALETDGGRREAAPRMDKPFAALAEYLDARGARNERNS